MSVLENYIVDLEDFELLALYKYRYDTFMKNSQKKIVTEIHKRNLDLKHIDDYISKAKGRDEELKNSVCCPRCYSRKFYLASEVDWKYSRYYSYKVTNDFKTCMVCLYSQDEKEYKKSRKKCWISRFIDNIG